MPVTVVDVPQPPWTYDLEIALFRAIISFRPVGLHKSLHLISILNAINSQISSSETPLTLDDLKSKLDELYNMEGLEEQEESEETEDEPKEGKFEEFELPYQDLVGFIEDHGKGVEGDCSQPASPEATMSVRSAKSTGGRGTKRRREESTAGVSNTDAGSEDEGIIYLIPISNEEFASPTTTTRQKRPRTAAAQRKTSASVTPAASVPSKRRGGRGAKKEESEGEEIDEEEEEETESVAETASVAETDGGPSKGLRTSSRRKTGQEEPASRGSRGRGRGGRGRGRGRGRGH
jgi:hypothetical protein